jgi:DNA-binding XRE family transcriptional regulator
MKHRVTTRRTITVTEQGHYTPSLLLAYDIAEALNISISEAFPPEWRGSPVDTTLRKPWAEGPRTNQTNGATRCLRPLCS